MAKRPRYQLNVELTLALCDRLEKHVKRVKHQNPAAVIKKADVVRSLLDKGLSASAS